MKIAPSLLHTILLCAGIPAMTISCSDPERSGSSIANHSSGRDTATGKGTVTDTPGVGAADTGGVLEVHEACPACGRG